MYIYSVQPHFPFQPLRPSPALYTRPNLPPCHKHFRSNPGALLPGTHIRRCKRPPVPRFSPYPTAVSIYIPLSQFRSFTLAVSSFASFHHSLVRPCNHSVSVTRVLFPRFSTGRSTTPAHTPLHRHTPSSLSPGFCEEPPPSCALHPPQSIHKQTTAHHRAPLLHCVYTILRNTRTGLYSNTTGYYARKTMARRWRAGGW